MLGTGRGWLYRQWHITAWKGGESTFLTAQGRGMSPRSESGVRSSADAYGSLVNGVQGGSLWTLSIVQVETCS